MTWGRGRRRKMGYEGSGPPRKAVDARITRGGVDFDLNVTAGTVTCTVCKLWGSSAGAELPEFCRVHAERHRGASPVVPEDRQACRSSERSPRITRLVEMLPQLGDDELEVLEEVAAGLVAGRAVYGELQIDTDQRDFARETEAEQRDALVYAAAGTIQARRARRRRSRGGGG